jgi:hypothetical protein
MLVKKNCKRCNKEFEYNKYGFRTRTFCGPKCALKALKGLSFISRANHSSTKEVLK